MEHNPPTVLAIGEIALFLIGTLLSIVLLAILLLPSLMRFTVPHWVRVKQREDSNKELFELLLSKYAQHGYQVIEQTEHRLVITKDNATRYHIYQILDGQGLSLFRQGDEVSTSHPTSILAGAGIAWVVILTHQALNQHQLAPLWGFDDAFKKTTQEPFSTVMHQVILLNPWR